MAIGKEIGRARRLGLVNYALYRRMRLRNRIFKVANLIGPARHECPCCGWRGMRFLDYVRETAIVEASVCPRCRGHARHRALAVYLEEVMRGLPERAAILHFAPERAFARAFAAHPRHRYAGVDIGARAISARADITAIPFRSGAFDLVLSSHVIEHVENERAALLEIARVLAPSGRALIMAPMVRGWETMPTVEFGRANFQGHWRQYGCDLTARIGAAGLGCAVVRPTENLVPELRRRYGLDQAPLFVARKPVRTDS
ncbi:MAG TPA: class I SAM-dependent methyltransferase [Candidatus Binataceae bacterium]|nr:class I SAM-dependent methyltransferase [Candidatus Binataceae bacterium]